jgi:hypothetical protein
MRAIVERQGIPVARAGGVLYAQGSAQSRPDTSEPGKQIAAERRCGEGTCERRTGDAMIIVGQG